MLSPLNGEGGGADEPLMKGANTSTHVVPYDRQDAVRLMLQTLRDLGECTPKER